GGRGGGCGVRGGGGGRLGGGGAEAGDSDADERVVERDLDPVRDEPRAAARYAVDAAVGMVEHRVPDPRGNGYGEQENNRSHRDDKQGAPAPGDCGGEDDARRERDEARLREREEQAGPDRR